MKSQYSILIVSILFSILGVARGQQLFTPYDNFPGLIISHKPAFDADFPEWGKMLYAYPVNFNDINTAYEKYMRSHEGEKNALIRYFKQWREAVGPYAQPDGSIVVPDLQEFYSGLSEAQKNAVQRAIQRDEANWTFVGPVETYWLNESGSSTDPLSCPWQVNVYAFDVAATDYDVLYVGTETGYMNKTTDGGFNWQFLASEYPFGGGVTAVAIHPDDANTVFVSAGNNIHLTTDGGLSWVPLLQSGDQFYANRLKIDDEDPQLILASSADGVYVTINGGNTWTQKWSSPVWDVDIKPDNHNIQYALTRSGNYFALAVSTNGGQSFSLEPSFPSSIVESSGGLLAVTPASPDQLWVIMLSADNTPYLYRGEYNSGNWYWDLISTGQTSTFQMNNGQGYFDLVLDVSPINANYIMVGTTTLFKSLNGGLSFTAVGGYSGNFSIHPDIQDIKMLPNGNTWVSTDGGMNLTTDNFGTQANYHVRVNGLIGSDFWGFDQGWNEDIMVGGRYHNGNTAIADFYNPKALRMGGAESPTGWVIQGRSRHVAFNDLGNGWILPNTAEGEPEGRFIFSKYPNMDEYGGRRSNLVTHPNYYGIFFLGEENSFWKSTDMGVNYELLYTFPGRVRYLQISYKNPDVFYADIVNYGLYKSEDGGLTWEQKPALCNSPNGTSYWKGKLFFAISPYDENVIYACLSNGTWTADVGKVFKSVDGGDSWEDWTGSLSEYTKNLVVQPSPEGTDIVYMFSTSREGAVAGVYCRTEGMDDWETFSTNYPAGMDVNMALPFYRDGKLRVAGNSGVWESPLKEPEFTPIINPWVERAHFNCMLDTLYFDDHSIMNHTGTSWNWEITPEPVFIEDPNMRNPKVVLGNPGSYSVTLTVTKNGQDYSKTIENMITTTTCPSIEDCSNPAELPKDIWELLYVDSEEVVYPGLAVMSFDDDPETIWHTRWSTGTDPYPHEIQIDMGETYRIYGFTYLTRQTGVNGRIKDYELYISEDPANWGAAVSTGQWVNTSAPQSIDFPEGVIGRYFRVLALSEINGGPWASAAEFSMVGCTDLTYDVPEVSVSEEIRAFPVPSNGKVNISLPEGNNFRIQITDMNGNTIRTGIINENTGDHIIDLSACNSGLYIISLVNPEGIRYHVRVVKN